jgi:hypothetical protein
VAARFGIGSDFWLNLFLTIAGYIPGKIASILPKKLADTLTGHVHNFYIQVGYG